MPAISIVITSPLADSTVASPFTATGTYSVPSPSVTIVVVLKDSAGTVVATGSPTTAAGGNWTSVLSPSQGYTGATVVAMVSGTSLMTSQGNITVT